MKKVDRGVTAVRLKSGKTTRCAPFRDLRA